MANTNDVKDLFKSNRLVLSTYDINNEFYGLMVDGAISESYSYNNDITDHPVENGSAIQDHIRTKPQEITITGIISDDPISYEAMYEDIRDFLKDENSNRSLLAYTFFKYISTSRAPVTIYTKNEIYVDYYIKSFSENKTKATAHGLKFTATFKEVQFVDTDFVETKADTLAADVANRAQKKNNQGTKKKKSVTPEKAKPKEDLAKKLINWALNYKK